MFKDSKIKNVVLNKRKNEYLLCVTYEAIDELGNMHEVIFDNVPLHIFNKVNYVSINRELCDHLLPSVTVDLGFGEIYCLSDSSFTDKIVKYATKEMTLEEIEKKLGHKVKIVSDKEKDNE